MTGPQYSGVGFECIPAKWYTCTDSPDTVPPGRLYCGTVDARSLLYIPKVLSVTTYYRLLF